MALMIQWIQQTLQPRSTTSDEALYQYMESQSGRSLSEVYIPFDGTKVHHWNDRGAILDFVEAVGTGDLLDVGPGDGWPSLPVARMARSVTGLDASPKRIAVCEENARRMGIANFRGAVYTAGEPLPFADASFDGIMASSALEQTPDPRAMLRELYRVLKPDGKLRFRYECPQSYGPGGVPKEPLMWPVDSGTTFIYVMDYDWTAERATYYSLVVAAPLAGVKGMALDALQPLVTDCMTYSLHLPSCRTWLAWLREAGFTSAVSTYGGTEYAIRLFAELPPEGRPADMAAFDALLRPQIRVVTRLEAPLEKNMPITATK